MSWCDITLFSRRLRGLKDTQIFTDLFRANQRVFNPRYLREIAFRAHSPF
jgi:hypothetical protein